MPLGVIVSAALFGASASAAGLPVAAVLPAAAIAPVLVVADPVSSPATAPGRWLHGGLFGALVRMFTLGWQGAAAVCAILVSAATVSLRRVQAANRAAGEQARIESLVRGIPGMAELPERSGGTLGTVVIDLKRGRAASDITTDTLATALSDPANWSALGPGEDLAGLGQRPDYAQVHILRDRDEVPVMLLPIAGSG
jgi:hypothetical protein